MAIRLEFKSDSKQAQRDLNKMEKSVENLDKNVEKTTKTMDGLAKAATVAAIAFSAIYSVKNVTRVLDEFTNIENRIALVTGRTKELGKAFTDLQGVARKTRTSLTGTADLYSRIARSTKELGTSQRDLVTVTTAIQQAIVVSGASAESANAAIVQLGQGLAASALRGQELNSVMEQTPRVAQAIADSLGIGLGELREMAAVGKITSEVVLQAFLDQAVAINSEFKNLNATFGQGFLRVGEEIGFLVSQFFKGAGATKLFSDGLINLATSLGTVADKSFAVGEATGIFMRDLFNLGKAIVSVFSAVGKQIAANLPILRGPTFSALRSLTIGFVQYSVFIRGELFEANRALARSMNNVFNTLTFGIFRVGEFNKAVRKILKAKSIQEMTDGFNLLAKALDPSRFTIANLSRKFSRLRAETMLNIDSISAFLGFTDTIWFNIGAINFKPLLTEMRGVVDGFGAVFDVLIAETGFFLEHWIGTIRAALFGDLGMLFSEAGHFSAAVFFAPFQLTGSLFTSVFKSISLVFKDIGSGLNIIAKGTQRLTLVGDALKTFVDTLDDIALDVKEFSLSVIGFFKDIYIEVVGASWWPDTMLALTAWAALTLPGLTLNFLRFKNIIIGTFKDIYDERKKILDAIGGVSKYVVVNVRLLITNLPDLRTALIVAFSSASLFFLEDFKREYPKTFSAMSDLLTNFLLKAIGAPGIVRALTSVGSLLAVGIKPSEILQPLEIGVTALANTMGNAVGAIFSALPQILVGLVPLVYKLGSNFVSGILDNLGLVGDALNLIVDIPSVNIISSLFFGSIGVVGVLSQLSTVQKAAASIFSLETDKKGKLKVGLFQAIFYGTKGTPSLIASGIKKVNKAFFEFQNVAYHQGTTVQGLGAAGITLFGPSGYLKILRALDIVKNYAVGIFAAISTALTSFSVGNIGLVGKALFGGENKFTSFLATKLKQITLLFSILLSAGVTKAGTTLGRVGLVLFGRGGVKGITKGLATIKKAFLSLQIVQIISSGGGALAGMSYIVGGLATALSKAGAGLGFIGSLFAGLTPMVRLFTIVLGGLTALWALFRSATAAAGEEGVQQDKLRLASLNDIYVTLLRVTGLSSKPILLEIEVDKASLEEAEQAVDDLVDDQFNRALADFSLVEDTFGKGISDALSRTLWGDVGTRAADFFWRPFFKATGQVAVGVENSLKGAYNNFANFINGVEGVEIPLAKIDPKTFQERVLGLDQNAVRQLQALKLNPFADAAQYGHIVEAASNYKFALQEIEQIEAGNLNLLDSEVALRKQNLETKKAEWELAKQALTLETLRAKSAQENAKRLEQILDPIRNLTLLGTKIGLNVDNIELAILPENLQDRIEAINQSTLQQKRLIESLGRRTGDTAAAAYRVIQDNMEEIKGILGVAEDSIASEFDDVLSINKSFLAASEKDQLALLAASREVTKRKDTYEEILRVGREGVSQQEWDQLRLAWEGQIQQATNFALDLQESIFEEALTPMAQMAENFNKMGIQISSLNLAKVAGKLPEQIQSDIDELTRLQELLKDPSVIFKASETFKDADIEAELLRDKLNKALAELFKTPKALTAFEQEVQDFTKIGVSLSGSGFAKLFADSVFNGFRDEAKLLASQLASAEELSGAGRTAALAKYHDEVAELDKRVQKAALSKASKPNTTDLQLLNALSTKAIQGITEAEFKSYAQRARGLELFKTELDKLGDQASYAQIQTYVKANEAFKVDLKEISEEFSKMGTYFKEFSGSFGNLFADAVRNLDFSSFAEDFVGLLLDNLTNALAATVSDFAEGFLNALLGTDEQTGILGALFGGTGVEGAGGLGSAAGEGAKGLIGSGVDAIGGAFSGEEEGTSVTIEGVDGLTESLTDNAQKTGILSQIQTVMQSILGIGQATEIAAMTVEQASASIMQAAMFSLIAAMHANTTAVLANTIAQATNYATGGFVSGPGTGTSDSINASLSNGEYVVNAASTRMFRGTLESINRRKSLPGFASGGLYETGQMVQSQTSSSNGSGNGGNTANIVFQLEGDFDARSEKAIRKMINAGTIQNGLNQAEIENGGTAAVFKTP